MPLKQFDKYAVPVAEKFEAHTSRKTHSCWDLKNQFYQSTLFRNLQVIRHGLHLRNVDGSTFAWDVTLPM